MLWYLISIGQRGLDPRFVEEDDENKRKKGIRQHVESGVYRREAC